LVTIVGNGIGGYRFDNLPREIDLESFDVVVCDKNFEKIKPNIKPLSYKDAKKFILKNYKKMNILYVVTGSALFFSAGAIIAKIIPKKYLKIVPSISSKEYLLSKLAISENEIDSLSLHGKIGLDLSRFLKKRYTLILCDVTTISRLQKITEHLNREDLEWIIGYKLGYKDEFVGKVDPYNHNFNLKEPYVILLKRNFDYQLNPFKDEQFVTQRGVITKQYKRDFSLHLLELYPNLVFWDIGAGSGSCAIEAYRRYRVRSVLFEKSPTRVENIKKNLNNLKVCDSMVVEGEAERNFDRVEQNPDRVFIGGGGLEVIKAIPKIFDRLNRDGIIVAVAVTLKNLTNIINVLDANRIDYEAISLSFTNYKGDLKMAEPQREIFQIRIKK
jgi:precorrin-6Y C5,15-methyltransferase (decarboxylating)